MRSLWCQAKPRLHVSNIQMHGGWPSQLWKTPGKDKSDEGMWSPKAGW